ncbi:MAG: hypothetical protein V1754_01275 [Pseudomonadota bacterium]
MGSPPHQRGSDHGVHLLNVGEHGLYHLPRAVWRDLKLQIEEKQQYPKKTLTTVNGKGQAVEFTIQKNKKVFRLFQTG